MPVNVMSLTCIKISRVTIMKTIQRYEFKNTVNESGQDPKMSLSNTIKTR